MNHPAKQVIRQLPADKIAERILRGETGQARPRILKDVASRILLLAAIFALCACKGRTDALVVLDDEWAVKQAIADCQSRKSNGVPVCVGDPTADIRELEAQTVRAFKTAPECRGMELLILNGSRNPSRVNARNTWWLFLEFVRSNVPDGLRYVVVNRHDPDAGGSMRGQGHPDSIVREFCPFVRQGGNIE